MDYQNILLAYYPDRVYTQKRSRNQDTDFFVKHLRAFSIDSSSSDSSSTDLDIPSCDCDPFKKHCLFCWQDSLPPRSCSDNISEKRLKDLFEHAVQEATMMGQCLMIAIKFSLKSIDAEMQSLEDCKPAIEESARSKMTDLLVSFFHVFDPLRSYYINLLKRIHREKLAKLKNIEERKKLLLRHKRSLCQSLILQKAAIEHTNETGYYLQLSMRNNETNALISKFKLISSGKKPLFEIEPVNSSTNQVDNPEPTEEQLSIKEPRIQTGLQLVTPQEILLPFEIPPIVYGRPIFGSPHAVIVQRGQVLAPNHYQPPIQVIDISDQRLTNGNNLSKPWGVTCDRNSNILVTDRLQHQVLIFTITGTLIRRFGEEGTLPGQFDKPAGITIDALQRIIVADKDNHRIQIFTMEGKFLLEFGREGNRPGEFHYPWDVATNSNSEIVVSDSKNFRIQLFSSTGKYLREFGGLNTQNKPKSLLSPRGVAFKPDGSVVVTDLELSNVFFITQDFKHSTRLSDRRLYFEQLHKPQGVVVDDTGNVIIADSRNNRLKIYNRDFKLQKQFVNLENAHYYMNRPCGVALLPDGRIVCVDLFNSRILIQ